MTTTGVEPLVGRERELARLEEVIAGALEAPQLLLLEGEPGIGKTSLWRVGLELGRDRGFSVLSARPAEPEAALSFAALGDLLAEVTDAIGALPEPQRRALRVALLLDEQSGGAVDSRTLSVALLGLLRKLAEDRPVLIAVDDVQWLDPPSAAALTFALRRGVSEPISFLGTVRPQPIARAVEGMDVFAVGPLDASATEMLVRRALDVPPPRSLVRRLGETSGGNPFYALELARAFLADDRQHGPTDPLPIPTNLSDLLRRRLQALSPPSRRALAAAAALAQPTRQVVERAVDADVAGLAPAAAAGIIAVEDGAIRFTHPLLAAAVYGETDPQARRELHRRLAAAVVDPEERARHLALALDPPNADVAAALEKAAERAFGRGATESAAALIENAVRFTPSGTADALHRRRLTTVGYLARTGARIRARELLDQATAAASNGRARAEIALTGTWFGLFDSGEKIETLRAAIDDVGNDRVLLAKLHNMIVSPLMYSPDAVAAERHAAIALKLAEEIGDEGLLAFALIGVANTDFMAGRRLDVGLLEHAAELEATAGNLYGNVSVAEFILGRVLDAAGALDRARRIFEREVAEERRRGDIGVAAVLSELARVELAAGNWDRAQSLSEEALDVAREADDTLVQAFAYRRLTAVAVLRGEVGNAHSLAAEGLRIADVADTPASRAEIYAYLGLLELSLEHTATAASHFEEAERFVTESGFRDALTLAFVPDHVEALIAAGDLRRANATTMAYESQAKRLGVSIQLAVAARCRGQIAAARGDLDRAVEILAEAHASASDLGYPFALARIVLAEGTALRRARRVSDARQALAEALWMFETLGAGLWEQRARAELARLGGRPARTRELTDTERQIADLVATGKTNHEVGRTLHLSPKTVEWNLSKIYRKLRVSSRAELAAKYAGQLKES